MDHLNFSQSFQIDIEGIKYGNSTRNTFQNSDVIFNRLR